MKTATKRDKNKRLTKGDWIRQGLEAIAKEGGRKMSIDDLVATLKSSKGSFYWHFPKRSVFVHEVMTFWEENCTHAVGKQLKASGITDPKELLRLLMTIVCKGSHSRYDIAIRTWATQEQIVADHLKKVDKYRLKVVTQLFERMGFTGDDLVTRARTFEISQCMEDGFSVKLTKRQQLKLIDQRVESFTQKRPIA